MSTPTPSSESRERAEQLEHRERAEQLEHRERAEQLEQAEQFIASGQGSHGCSCAELRERLFEFLDRELDDSECARLERHVHGCPDCEAAADAEAHIRRLLKRSCAEQAPQDLRARVVAQLTVLRTVSLRATEVRRSRG